MEILVYTQNVDGVTDNDLKMIELYDAVPVNYSIFWKKQHSDLLDRLGQTGLLEV